MATRGGWSGKYHDASRKGVAVEQGVEQGRRIRAGVTRFQWRARAGAGGAGRRRDGQGGTTTPAGSPSPRNAEPIAATTRQSICALPPATSGDRPAA